MAPPTTHVHTPNRPAGTNRALLTVVGLVLLVAGAYTVLRGTGVLATTGLPVPAEPTSTVLPAGLTVAGWEPWVAIAASVIVGLLCLRWLGAQAQRRASANTWRQMGDPEHGTTTVDTAAATDMCATEIATYTGITAASAKLTGDPSAPHLHLVVTVEDRAPVSELRERIDTDALPRLRQALELATLPTEVLLRLGAKPASARTN